MRNYKLLFVFILFTGFCFGTAYSQGVMEPEMVFVEGGEYMMGYEDGQDDEKPVHKVVLDDFYIGKYEVKEVEFTQFAEEKGISRRERPGWHESHHPAIFITWNLANEYCEWLSEKTGDTYRLPTEAEWEYAARGGQKSQGYLYSGSNNIDEVCVYYGNAQSTEPVGSKSPNELGLYDMSGNVWEWCLDFYSKDYYYESPEENPSNRRGTWRVIRGGSWAEEAYKTRVTFRNSNIPSNAGFNDGLRVVKETKKE